MKMMNPLLKSIIGFRCFQVYFVISKNYNRFLKIRESIGLPLPKWELLGNVRVHSFTFSYTPKNMRCDSRASLLARTPISPCLGHKPKAKVVTMLAYSQPHLMTMYELLNTPHFIKNTCKVAHLAMVLTKMNYY